jgi:hypothetical protein
VAECNFREFGIHIIKGKDPFLLTHKISDWVLGAKILFITAHSQTIKKTKKILLFTPVELASNTKTAYEAIGVFFTFTSLGKVHRKTFSILFLIFFMTCFCLKIRMFFRGESKPSMAKTHEDFYFIFTFL